MAERKNPNYPFEQSIENTKNLVYEAINPLSDMIWEMAKTITNWLMSTTPSSRVKYLAIYHKKKRVRKKNLHRITKELKKELYK